MVDGIKELDLCISLHILFPFIHLQAGWRRRMRRGREQEAAITQARPQGLQELYFQHRFMLSQWLTHQ